MKISSSRWPGRARWINGQGDFAESDSPYRQADDMTTSVPSEDPAHRRSVTPETDADRSGGDLRAIHGGAGPCELVRTIVEGDLVVVVLIERSTVTFKAFDRRNRGSCARRRCFARRPMVGAAAPSRRPLIARDRWRFTVGLVNGR